MPHKFKITAAAGDQFKFAFLYNSESLVWSENYKAKASAKSAIESLKKNAPDAIVVDLSKGEEGKGYRFEIAPSKDQFFVRFVAPNGETMVRSETYTARASAVACIDSVKKNGPTAPIEDEA